MLDKKLVSLTSILRPRPDKCDRCGRKLDDGEPYVQIVIPPHEMHLWCGHCALQGKPLKV